MPEDAIEERIDMSSESLSSELLLDDLFFDERTGGAGDFDRAMFSLYIQWFFSLV